MNRRQYLTTSGATIAAASMSVAALAAGSSPAGQPQGPDVRVVNKPNEPVRVSLQGSAQIDTSSPIPVRDVDRLAREPVQFALFVPGPNSFTVPNGKRLVIEFVSGSFAITGSSGALAGVTLSLSPGSLSHVFAGTPVSYNDGEAGGLAFAFSQACLMHAAAGESVSVHGSQGVLFLSLSASGYLEDVS
jgi:hypothetical protein